MFRLYFYPVADSLLLVVVTALVLAGLLLLRPARRSCPGGGGWRVAVARAAVIAMVVLAMLRPTLVYTETKKEKATLTPGRRLAEHVGPRRCPAGEDPLGGVAGRLGRRPRRAAGVNSRLRGEGLRLRPGTAPAGNRRRRQNLPPRKTGRTANRHGRISDALRRESAAA